MPVVVHGLKNISKGFKDAGREARLGWRHTLRDVAEPVRRDAAMLAGTEIRNMPRSPRWARMRTGITQSLVYVAPRQRGVRKTGNRRLARPNLAGLLMDRAMQPALDRHEHEIEVAMERVLDKVADDFNRG